MNLRPLPKASKWSGVISIVPSIERNKACVEGRAEAGRTLCSPRGTGGRSGGANRGGAS